MSNVPALRHRRPRIRRRRGVLLQRIPCAAVRAFAQPFQMNTATLIAKKLRAGFSHEHPILRNAHAGSSWGAIARANRRFSASNPKRITHLLRPTSPRAESGATEYLCTRRGVRSKINVSRDNESRTFMRTQCAFQIAKHPHRMQRTPRRVQRYSVAPDPRARLSSTDTIAR